MQEYNISYGHYQMQIIMISVDIIIIFTLKLL